MTTITATLPLIDEQFKEIIRENIASSYINILNYKKAEDWKCKIISEYVTRFYRPDPSFRYDFWNTSNSYLEILSVTLFEEMKPSTDWNAILNSWQEMNNKIFTRINVEQDSYTDDLDYPPTNFYCYQFNEEILAYNTDYVIKQSTIDAMTNIFMDGHDIPEEYFSRVRDFIVYELKHMGTIMAS